MNRKHRKPIIAGNWKMYKTAAEIKTFSEQFKSGLTERDKIILQMRYEGYSYQEIADKVGFKTPSAVRKRMDKIAGSYADFIGN